MEYCSQTLTPKLLQIFKLLSLYLSHSVVFCVTSDCSHPAACIGWNHRQKHPNQTTMVEVFGQHTGCFAQHAGSCLPSGSLGIAHPVLQHLQQPGRLQLDKALSKQPRPLGLKGSCVRSQMHLGSSGQSPTHCDPVPSVQVVFDALPSTNAVSSAAMCRNITEKVSRQSQCQLKSNWVARFV
eukprot:gnl/MRDRNA2_/MRDRNA2_173151_c0_seq1.p1 gnl/MRDRNA2_/MRDRNA2_173151_c0~~gnl/MRDRNA2_/MRDRNA2_173151_c0_seq1.p1  ORF type:complete len:182 (+),score=17.33 gnl/MRDRNA2_/MRDRNA2_173151_c0_seq1:121-666(+)